MQKITSAGNPLIKSAKKLHKKKNREEEQRYLLEGFHLIEEARKARIPLATIFVNQRGLQEWAEWIKQQPEKLFVEVSDEVLKSLSDQLQPQGMIAIAAMQPEMDADFSGGWLLLDRVQDPGNVGTMVRTADAAGLSGVIFGEGTADLYSLKTLRSMQGSNFHLPILRRNLKDVVSQLQAAKIPVFGTALDARAITFEEQPPVKDFGLIMGNEGQGVSDELLQQTDRNLYIPLRGQAESLNVGVAAGILLYRLLP